jgi:hypothetical protein
LAALVLVQARILSCRPAPISSLSFKMAGPIVWAAVSNHQRVDFALLLWISGFSFAKMIGSDCKQARTTLAGIRSKPKCLSSV